MSTGCFSWCPLLRRCGAKKQTPEIEGHQQVAEIVMDPESDEKLSGNTRAVVPTTTQYFMATGKQALALLQTAASVIPVPLLKDAIGIAMKIIEVCEEASAVQKQVKELQERVTHLMIAIVDNVTVHCEGGDGVVMKAVEGIEKDVKDFLRTLVMIDKELTEIRKQNEWLQGLYTDLNMEAVDGCLDQLSAANEKFKLANDLRGSNLLVELHERLQKISAKINDIHADVKDVAKAVKDISTYLSKSKRSATMLLSDSMVRHQMPLKPGIFHGRDSLVDEIARCLVKKETAHVCLLGPGGMGKTSVSLAVVELPLIKKQFPGGNCFWVPCIEATTAGLLLEILYIQLQVPGDKQVKLEKIISHLNASKQPRLILLDNFETPWNAPGTGTQKQIEDILRQLAELSHIAIFVTMRGTNPPCNNVIHWQSKNIDPTDEQACLRIYHDNNPRSKDDPDVGRLLALLGYMPFAVTLMAKLGMEGKSTAKELLDAWRESGPDVLSDRPEESMNRSISLSVESDLIKWNPNAMALLSILSLLPAGTTKQNLRWWALDSGLKPSMIPSAIPSLSKAALLVENKRENSDTPVLFVVPVVQSFMQQHGRIEEKIWKQIQSSCCQFVLDHACRYDDPTFSDKSKALAAEDTNIQSILVSAPHTIHTERTINALIGFSWHRCDTMPDLEIANHAVKVAKASAVKRYIASAVWCLGWTYRQLGDVRSSYNHVQEAYLLSNDPSANDVELQRMHCKCGTDLVEVGRVVFEDMGEVVTLARDVESKCAALSDDHLHGWSLVRLGAALNEAEQRQEALEHLTRAVIMLKAVKNIPYLASAYQVIAVVFDRERRLPEALDAIQEAWKLIESSSNLNTQAIISLDSGLIHFSANRDAEAWKHTERALMKASQVGNRLITGRALELMGYGYLRRGDYENAYGAYEAAAEKYCGTMYGETRCQDNMARIRRKQKDPDLDVGFKRLNDSKLRRKYINSSSQRPAQTMAYPLPPPNPPVQFRTPSPQSNPTKHHQSSPVKPAEHKRDEVRRGDLPVSEEAIGKHSGKVSEMVDEKADEEANHFSRENFVQAANKLARSMKDDCFANVPLLVFKSTESKTPRGHITDTECRPDFTAAFDIHWGGEATTLWPCIRLAGEDASAGKSKKYQENQAVSYLHYLLLARPDLHVAQGLLISVKRIMFLFGIGGRGIYRLSADWTDLQLNRLMFAFFYRHFGDATYVAMVPNFQNDFVEYTIRISIKTLVDGVETNEGLDCHGFSPIYATSPFGSRTHILSNPLSDICVDGKVVTVVKDQLSRPDPRFDEYTILNKHVHSPEKVPGVVEAVCHELVEISESLGVPRVKHRMGLRQSGSPIMSIQTLRGMLEVMFDVLEVLRYLRVERQVLHRDISRGNVLYIPEGATPAPDGGETKEASLYFVKFLLGESTIPQKTSALLIDFNNAEHLESRQGGKRSPRTGTPVFIARAVQQGNAVLPPKLGFVPAVPSSPEPYTRHHLDRIEKFPLEEEKVVRRSSAHNVTRQWRHELDHDAESVFWLFLYWLVLAQPGQSPKEDIKMSTWSNLTGSVDSRSCLLLSLSQEVLPITLTHSVFQPLLPLLCNLAAILVVERHWLDESETRNDPEYVPEALQRLILQFILDNRDKEFMTKQVDLQPRQVEGVGQNPNLLSTASSRRDENRRKRPSPRPSKQRQKRRRLAAEEVAKEASDSEEDTDKEQDSEEEQSEYEEDDEEMASDSE